MLKNNEAIENMFRDCIDKAIGELIIVLGHTNMLFSYVKFNIHCTCIAERFRQLTKNNNRIPRTTSAFKAVVEAAGSGAKEVC